MRGFRDTLLSVIDSSAKKARDLVNGIGESIDNFDWDAQLDFFAEKRDSLIERGNSLLKDFGELLKQVKDSFNDFSVTVPFDESIGEKLDFSINGNKLKGNVFCYIPQGNEDPKLKNALEYTKSTMRVLGSVNGILAFVADNDKALKTSKGVKYIPANKVYLPINAAYNTKTANGIELLLPEEYEAVIAGINNITVDEKDNTDAGIYTLTGVKVKEDNNTEGLKRGIYIIDGKKQVIQ